jgi:hypothetical protein
MTAPYDYINLPSKLGTLIFLKHINPKMIRIQNALPRNIKCAQVSQNQPQPALTQPDQTHPTRVKMDFAER